MDIDIEDLQEKIRKDPRMSDKDKEIHLKRANASAKIICTMAEFDLNPIEEMRILLGIVCGMTVACGEPFRAIGYIHECMAEFYNYYEIARKSNGDIKDSDGTR